MASREARDADLTWAPGPEGRQSGKYGRGHPAEGTASVPTAVTSGQGPRAVEETGAYGQGEGLSSRRPWNWLGWDRRQEWQALAGRKQT